MTIYHGDCLDVMAFDLQPESVDAVVTDPPYGLGFMGESWDHGAPGAHYWRLMLRAAKPGAHLLAFGGTRTVHRIASSIEDAGWEIRDMLVWAYASGFPKSANPGRTNDLAQCRLLGNHSDDDEHRCARVSPDEWYRLGTALKPSWEPIVMARKPLRGTVPTNVAAYGTGALNIDETRLEGVVPKPGNVNPTAMSGANGIYGLDKRTSRQAEWEPHADGRWPANVILTDPIFDGGWEGVVGGGEQDSGSGHILRDSASRALNFRMGDAERTVNGGSGTYSRFFLIPKADRSEREPIAGMLPDGFAATMGNGIGGREHDPADPRAYRQNTHPTVKPVDLMRHLVRLVTPPGGTVLDPFLGSGTTGIACEMEGFDWIGIEREAEYVAIAEARLEGVQRGMGLSA